MADYSDIFKTVKTKKDIEYYNASEVDKALNSYGDEQKESERKIRRLERENKRLEKEIETMKEINSKRENNVKDQTIITKEKALEGSKVTKLEEKEIYELYEKYLSGASKRQLAKEYEISRGTVDNYIQRVIRSPRQAGIRERVQSKLNPNMRPRTEPKDKFTIDWDSIDIDLELEPEPKPKDKPRSEQLAKELGVSRNPKHEKTSVFLKSAISEKAEDIDRPSNTDLNELRIPTLKHYCVECQEKTTHLKNAQGTKYCSVCGLFYEDIDDLY